MKLKSVISLFAFILAWEISLADANPFLAPGQKRPTPPAVVKPAPPPPKPIPRNPNLEFRGYYKFEGEWKFAIFDKAKNQGFWLKKDELSDDGSTEIESFDDESEKIVLKGGISLKLKESEGRTLPIAGMQSASKTIQKKLPIPAPARIPAPVKRPSTRTR